MEGYKIMFQIDFRKNGYAVAAMLFFWVIQISYVPAVFAQTYNLQVSPSPNRSSSVVLQGATIAGNVYVFTSPDTDVDQVKFWLEYPTFSGPPIKIENVVPFDFAGTAGGGTAFPYDTTQLADGTHTITAEINLDTGGQEVIEASFDVDNSGGVQADLSVTKTDGVTSAAAGTDLTYTITASNIGPADVINALVTDTFNPAVFNVANISWFCAITAGTGNCDDGLGNGDLNTTVDLNAGATATYTVITPILGSATGTALNTATLLAPISVIDTVLSNNSATDNDTTLTGGINPYSLQMSLSPNRVGPVALEGTTDAGDIYVFTSPDTDVMQVKFWLDDPTFSGPPFRTENVVPYDFAGTMSGGTAGSYDTAQLTDGAHNIAATVKLGDGSIFEVSSNFTVDNTTAVLGFTPASLSFQVIEGDPNPSDRTITLDTSDGNPASFTADDDASWLSVTPLLGTTPATLTVSVDYTGLLPGIYSAQISTQRIDNMQISAMTVTLQLDTGTSLDCGPLPCSEALINIPYVLEFDTDHDKILDNNSVGTGFTYLMSKSTGQAYLPQNLDVVTGTNGGVLKITSTNGLFHTTSNSQDNALGVGIDIPSQRTIISTTLTDLVIGTGSFEQAGLWFGNDEDNYIKLTLNSSPTGSVIEFFMEVNAQHAGNFTNTINPASISDLTLNLTINPFDSTVKSTVSEDGSVKTNIGTFTPPEEFFSFDAAGIDPTIGTRSFGGIYASHRNASTPILATFKNFSVTKDSTPIAVDNLEFSSSSISFSNPTSMVWGPDDRLYVLGLFGEIEAITPDPVNQFADPGLVNRETITAFNDAKGSRLSLGLTVDPDSTAGNVTLWVSHSSPSLNNGEPNTGTVSRISQSNPRVSGFDTVEDIITGLPRAIANHAINSIHFGPDGRLYVAIGGNTGAGAPNDAITEFGPRSEQPLSAALLVADVKNPSFDGDCGTVGGAFPNPSWVTDKTVDDGNLPLPGTADKAIHCDVQVFSSGLRNTYDFTFHSNGSVYAPDNGLGVKGSFPPFPVPDCQGLADTTLWTEGGNNPGTQPDLLNRLQQGKHYGHPNPALDECVFKDGSFQGIAPAPSYKPPVAILGNHISANGIVEYPMDVGCVKLQGELLISNFSVGDDITRVKLDPSDPDTVVSVESLVGVFNNPLPLALNPDGTIYVGEFGGSLLTALQPGSLGCWSDKDPLPQDILDLAGDALNGKLYVVGGKNATGHLKTLYIYDPFSNVWTQGPDLPAAYPAVENPAVVSSNGKLYVFGGFTAPFSGAVSNAAVFNPASSSWTNLTPIPTARGGITARVIGNSIYIAGGMDGTGQSLNTLEIYDPATDQWASAAPMSTRRDNPGAAALNGKLYVFGGRTRNADGNTVNAALNSMEVYYPATNVWVAGVSMPTGRRAMAVGMLNERIQAMGGEGSSSGNGVLQENEEYDPATDTWSTLTPMSLPRHGAAASTIGNTVYVVGGGVVSGDSFSDANTAYGF